MVSKHVNDHHNGSDDDDDGSTLAPGSITYSRSNGSFILHDQDNDDETVVGNIGNVHHFQDTFASSSNDRLLSSQLSSWNYNKNRVALKRVIMQAQNILHNIDLENDTRPINMGLDEPLHVLKLQVKLDGNYSSNPDDLNLDKTAKAKLFKTQVKLAMNHLFALQKRVDDISSKVFITGDVNTGKSNFCNTLLKRYLLPEDQLPCTNVFCEVLEARENENIEEVHAVTVETASTVKEAIQTYNIKDRSTYSVFPLEKLADLVPENKKYSFLKIYIKDDKKPPESSLLRNNIVNITLIDSPGLNIDSVQTSEVMTRQEEIDLVVFVVNAENQLTLSAKEFIKLASREKKFMFFVIKKFDGIKDKERCKKLILQQIGELSPESCKRSSQFVHFLSKKGDNGDHPDNSDSDDDTTNDEPDPDFNHLQDSLRNFVLKKRSLSKLMPAKTYLSKLLFDIEKISKRNIEIFESEDEYILQELKSLEPELDNDKQRCNELTSNVDRILEDAVNTTYEFTKASIVKSLSLKRNDLPQYQGIAQLHEYIFNTEQFIKDKIKSSIRDSERYAKSVTEKSVERINVLGKQKLGDDFMSGRVFDSGLMFSQIHHSLTKRLSVRLSVFDLFAPSVNGFLFYLSYDVFRLLGLSKSIKDVSKDEVEVLGPSSTSLGHSTYSLAQYWKTPSLLFTSRIPTLAIYSFGGAKLITNFVVQGIQFFSWETLQRIAGPLVIAGSLLGISYVIHDLPRALPANLLLKYQAKLLELDYTHVNAERISKEVREVLKVPSREISKSCDLFVDKKLAQRENLLKKQESNIASIKFFKQLLERANVQKDIVDSINLDVD